MIILRLSVGRTHIKFAANSAFIAASSVIAGMGQSYLGCGP